MAMKKSKTDPFCGYCRQRDAGIGAASAADLPVKALSPVLPVFSWTGCYVGVHAGAGVLLDQGYQQEQVIGTALAVSRAASSAAITRPACSFSYRG